MDGAFQLMIASGGFSSRAVLPSFCDNLGRLVIKWPQVRKMADKTPGDKASPAGLPGAASLAETLRAAGIPVRAVRAENFKEKKGVWWVEPGAGSGGVYVLKKLSVSRERLEFLLAAVAHLRRRGVLIPAPVAFPAFGRPYFERDGAFYILSEAATGRTPRYDAPGDLDLIARALAGFHLASRGFAPPADVKEREHLGRWPEDYRRKRERLEEFAERAANDDSDFSREVLAAAPHFLDRARQAEEELERSAYARWCGEVAGQPILCHQDFAAGNLAVEETSPPGRVWIFDTDSLTIDLPVRDLRKVLNKVLKKGDEWDQHKAGDFLRSYLRTFPLTPEQLDVLRVDLAFPHLFYGTVSKYFEGRESEWTKDKFTRKLRQVIDFEQSKERFLDELKEG